MDGDPATRAAEARAWYADHGRPFVAKRRLEIDSLRKGSVTLGGGEILGGWALASRLQEGEAHGLLALLVSAGAEVDAEIDRRWWEGRPDEAFFLDRFAAAVAESLVSLATLAFCGQAGSRGETLLPHLSPGCGSWALEAQVPLMRLVSRGSSELGPVRMLDSGMLTPRASLLAACGITRQARPSADPSAVCRGCELPSCAFRRAPFRGMA